VIAHPKKLKPLEHECICGCGSLLLPVYPPTCPNGCDPTVIARSGRTRNRQFKSYPKPEEFR
jgi:hypothetical protein